MLTEREAHSVGRGIPFQRLLIKGAACTTNWRPLSSGVSGSRHSWARRQISTTQSSFPVFSSAECCDDTLALLNRLRNERAPSRVAPADSHARPPNPQSLREIHARYSRAEARRSDQAFGAHAQERACPCGRR